MSEELGYVVPLGIPHSRFLSWAEDDQDKAMAWLRDQATICPGCATRQREWAEDRFAFVAQTSTCPGCEVLAMERDNVPKDSKGVHLYLVRREHALVGDE